MSVRDQERRAREAMRKAAEVEKRIDERMKGAVRQSEEAMLRAEEVRRRIETGDVRPRPLPSLREDSIPSIPSMKSMESMESMKSTKSVELRDKRLASADYGEDYGKGKDYGKDYGKGKDYDEDY
jgi:hypothetical protein